MGAVSEEDTASRTILLVTEMQIVSLSEIAGPCAAVGLHAHGEGGAHTCSQGLAVSIDGPKLACAWAEGQEEGEHLCFECSSLERWAASQRPPVDSCHLELSMRNDTKYGLSGCGCMPKSNGVEREAELV